MNNIDKKLEEMDLGTLAKKSGIKPKRVKAQKHPTSIMLSESLKNRLKEKAEKKGLKYQSLLRMILVENIENY